MTSITATDPWLRPYANHIAGRQSYIRHKKKELLGSNATLEQTILGHLYYGLHQTDGGWIFREWAPNATRVFLTGTMTNWQDDPAYELQKTEHGNWEITLSPDQLRHGDLYALHIYWPDGDGRRIPSYANYVVQDDTTKQFSTSVFAPARKFVWKNNAPKPSNDPLIIYEAHVGMAGEELKVASYREFAKNVLPRIARGGYNTVQLMAIAEHPYYGSFGYHVSNYFAPSSRFGTPDDLKYLVDTAHGLGLRVIMDIVHSHAVKNEAEGLTRFDGTTTQYFHAGKRGDHEQWDSKVFDYAKPAVLHFLLSNCRYWLDEYHLDGFRFDGVTSMLYIHHGLGKAFTSYDDYFGADIDQDALAYLALANELIHQTHPDAVTIAEDMSGYPGLAHVEGIGFDYRLSMGVPDLWIKTLKEKRDEDWNLGHLLSELTAKRVEERVISYAESHDQALVGDKTLAFRLMNADMYEHMSVDDDNLVVERGIALHKLIRLITASTHGGGYLNFMGNEFGHPEWIDFPREGNDWSYAYARRQWHLVDDEKLKYHWLGAFDAALVGVVCRLHSNIGYVNIHEDKRTLSFERDGFVFVFNFSPDTSYEHFDAPAPSGSYRIVLDSDNNRFGGQSRVNDGLDYKTKGDKLALYLPARTALVLKRCD